MMQELDQTMSRVKATVFAALLLVCFAQSQYTRTQSRYLMSRYPPGNRSGDLVYLAGCICLCARFPTTRPLFIAVPCSSQLPLHSLSVVLYPAYHRSPYCTLSFTASHRAATLHTPPLRNPLLHNPTHTKSAHLPLSTSTDSRKAAWPLRRFIG